MTLRQSMVIGALVALVLGLVMITNESAWIDEVQTERFAAQPTFGAWFDELKNCTRSQAQMPLGMFVAWVGGKTLGTSEWQLRAVNLVWLALAGMGGVLIARMNKSWSWLAVLLLSPFLWYYTNEARPYVMLVCAGVWLLYLLLRLRTEPRLEASTLAAIIALSVIGYATHALFAFVVAGIAIAALPALWGARRELKATHALLFLAGLVCVAAVSAYYAWTVKQGAGGARIWKVGAGNILFTAYELLGFGGLGPPRNDLRDLARGSGLLKVFAQPQYIGAPALAALYIAIVFQIWRSRTDPLLRASVVVVIVGGAGLFAAAVVMHFPFWGRHAAGLLPFALFAAWRALANGFDRCYPRVILCLLLVAFAASAARQRFDAGYGKEDYRSACRLAENALAARLVVWWAADPEVPDYYHLPRTDAPAYEPHLVTVVVRSSADALEKARPPDVIILSKPDVHDEEGRVREYISRGRLTNGPALRGFVVWRRPEVDVRLLSPDLEGRKSR